MSRNCAPLTMLGVVLGLSAAPAFASDWIATRLKGSPERVYVSSRSLYDVERCVVFSGVRGWVYRMPDRPDETLLIAASGNFPRPLLWQLLRLPNGTVRFSVFQGEDNVNKDTEACFDRKATP
jgi:hypothetical protein